MYYGPITGVAVVGPRVDDDEFTKEKNKAFLSIVEPIITTKYGKDKYFIITLGCDTGFGYDLAQYCTFRNIRFVEVATRLCGVPYVGPDHRLPFATQEDVVKIFQARHATILELADEYYIRAAKSTKRAVIDDLYTRVRVSDKPYWVYNSDNEVIEYRGDPTNG